MSQDSIAVDTASSPGKHGGWGLIRSIAADRLTIVILLWAVLAFVVRPIALAAHHGAPTMASAGFAALTQWLAFAGAIAIAAMFHVRHSFRQERSGGARAALVIASGYTLALCAAYLAFIWEPASVLTLMVHDSFIFFDSTYRILHGQTPSADFPTPLGAATLYLPAWATWLTGSYGGSVELASIVVALFLGLLSAIVGAYRLPAAITAVLVVCMFMVAVPPTLLEGWGGYSFTLIDGELRSLTDDLTWGMFYNRWGWAGLIVAFAFLAPRTDGREPSTGELLCFAALLAFLFFTKLNYFIVAVGAALLFAGLNPRPLRSLLIGGGVSLALVLALGLSSGVLMPYMGDILYTAQISGGRSATLFPVLRENLVQLLLAPAPVVLLSVMGRANWKDWAVTAFILAASVYSIIQNAQTVNICSLISLGAYGFARLWPIEDRTSRLAAVGCFMILAAQPLLVPFMTVMDLAVAIRREEARPPARWSHIPALKGVHIVERETILPAMNVQDAGQDRIDLVHIIGAVGRRQEMRQGEFMHVILAGVKDLETVLRPGDSVIALDMSSPFAFLLNARQARGAPLSLHEGRTVSEEHHPEPEVMFADADHVMIARLSMLQSTSELMQDVYGDWLTANYEQRVESEFWIRFSRRKTVAD